MPVALPVTVVQILRCRSGVVVAGAAMIERMFARVRNNDA